MLAQDLLVVIQTVSTAAIAVEDAALWWRSAGDGHFQGPDRQIALHAVAEPSETIIVRTASDRRFESK